MRRGRRRKFDSAFRRQLSVFSEYLQSRMQCLRLSDGECRRKNKSSIAIDKTIYYKEEN